MNKTALVYGYKSSHWSEFDEMESKFKWPPIQKMFFDAIQFMTIYHSEDPCTVSVIRITCVFMKKKSISFECKFNDNFRYTQLWSLTNLYQE